MKTKISLFLILIGLGIILISSCEKDNDLTDDSIESKNEAPTDIILSDSVVNENDPVNAVIGVLTTMDVDTNDVHVYSLVSGNGDTDNGSFIISDDQLLTNEVFDYEAKSEYSIRVQTIDQEGNMYEEVFTITIQDLAECEDIAGVYYLTLTYSFSEGGMSGSGEKVITPVTVTQNGCSIKVKNCSGTMDEDNNVSFSGTMTDNVTQYFDGKLNTSTGIISGTLTGSIKVMAWNGLFMQTYTVSIKNGTFKLTPD